MNQGDAYHRAFACYEEAMLLLPPPVASPEAAGAAAPAKADSDVKARARRALELIKEAEGLAAGFCFCRSLKYRLRAPTELAKALA